MLPPMKNAAVLTLLVSTMIAADGVAQESSLLRRGESSDWVFKADIAVRSIRDVVRRRDEIPANQQWSLGTVGIIFPLLRETASAELRSRAVQSRFTINDIEVDDRPTFINNFPLGAQYGRWDFVAPNNGQIRANQAELHLSFDVTSYDTIYDDAAAEQVEWPDQWPEPAASSFEPMPFIDFEPGKGEYDPEPVRKLLERWTAGRDPKSLKPAVLAKFLAGQVVEHVQPSGQGLVFDRTGAIEGVAITPPPLIASRRRGSPIDMAVLLASVYREAGLPARLVFGLDADKQKGKRDRQFLERGGGPPELRVWVEFALIDPQTRSLAWIPVDPAAMRTRSSRMPRDYWTRPLPFFGTNDELDGVVPFSFHAFPPTTVRSYGTSGMPAFWGWFVTPESPEQAWQTLTLTVDTKAVGGPR